MNREDWMMAHYNLYDSLRLDRAKDAAALAQEIDQRIQAGSTRNPGGLEELQVARAVLGDPYRRSAYDQRLNDPNAPAMTPDSLRQLAHTNLGGGNASGMTSGNASGMDAGMTAEKPAEAAPLTGRPYQYGPSRQTSSLPQQHHSTEPIPKVEEGQESDKKKRTVWPIAAAAVALVALVGGGLWWFAGQGTGPNATQGTAWEQPYAMVAEDFPNIIAANDGGRGIDGLPCTAREYGNDETAKIRCVDDKVGITVIQYDTEAAREAAIPPSESVEHYGNEVCEFTSAKIPGQDTETYYMAPNSHWSNYLILVNGDSAANLRMRLPIC
ncbi:hypothetical protein HMPREF3101_08075 [Corynebacterium sp. HMSC29G08]|nr:hypothetical protein HMPREF3101_08075 [Corynebacterium sp. HMSC29G08]